jgi:thiamine biosynthesis lipoprotein
MEFDEFRAMNTTIVLAAEGPDVARAFRTARDFIAESEARFTRFSESSELMRLNRAAGEWFRATPDLFEVVREARNLSDATQGLFDPTILGDLLHVGYDRTFDDLRLTGATTAGAPRRTAEKGFEATEFDAADQAIRLPRGTLLDLGGIAKGWIAEKAAQRMSAFAPACAVSAGGDVFLFGHPAADENWSVGVEDPRDPDRMLTVLHVESGAVATSSRVRRRWLQDGIERHHLIDPRTGLPSASEWLAVTAIAPRAATAEAYAKALLVAGPPEAMRLADDLSDVSFLAVDADGQLWGPARVREVIDDAVGTV